MTNGSESGVAATSVRAPSDSDVAVAAGNLHRELLAEIRRTALRLMDVDPGPGRSVGREDPDVALVELRLTRQMGLDVGAAVVAARRAGVTWAQIGAACEVSRQGAYDRWHKAVKQDEAHQAAAASQVESW